MRWRWPTRGQALFLALVAESVEANLGTLEAFLASPTAKPSELKEKLGEWIDGIDERESLPAFGAELEIGELLVLDWAPHPAEGDKLLVIFSGRHLTAAELLERRDVYACDQCQRDFHPADEGYLCLWVTTPAELATWLEARFLRPG